MTLNIGENIKKLRAEKGVTQEQLADHLSITYQSVSKWERGETSPDLYFIPKIADFFDISIDELFLPNLKGYKHKAERLAHLYHYRYSTENYNKVATEYEKMIMDCSADEKDFGEFGAIIQSHAMKLFEKANDLFNKAIEMGDEKWHLSLILSNTLKGQHQKSIDKHEEMVKNHPEILSNWYFLAFSYGGYYGDGVNPEKAYQVVQEGLKLYPNSANLISYCGDICRGLKKFDEAIAYYSKANELCSQNSPPNGSPLYGLAFVYGDMQEYEKAIAAWENIIALHDRLEIPAEVSEMGKEWPRKEIEKLRTKLEQQARN